MAVRLVRAVRDGWRQKDNERFGQVMEVRFVDTTNGQVMFRYAPKLSDRPFWDETFGKLNRYDELHKEIYQLVQGLEGESFLSEGDVKRELKKEEVETEKKSYGKMGDKCE